MTALTAAYAVIPATFSKPAAATVTAFAFSSAFAPSIREVGWPGSKIRKVFNTAIQCETQRRWDIAVSTPSTNAPHGQRVRSRRAWRQWTQENSDSGYLLYYIFQKEKPHVTVKLMQAQRQNSPLFAVQDGAFNMQIYSAASECEAGRM